MSQACLVAYARCLQSRRSRCENRSNIQHQRRVRTLAPITKFSQEELETIIEKYSDLEGLYDSISEGQELSLDFIYKNFDKLDVENICMYQKVDYDFIYKHRNDLSLKKLSYNENLSEDMILKIYEKLNEFNDEFDWDYISEYIDLSEGTVKDIKELNKLKLIQKKLTSNE